MRWHKFDVNQATGWQVGMLHKKSLETGKRKVDTSRIGAIKVVVGALSLLMGLRLVFLQGVMGAEMRERGDNNRIYERKTEGVRGVFKDRNGEVLVVNEPVYLKIIDDEGRLMPQPKRVSRDEAMALGGEAGGVIYEIGRNYTKGQALAHVLGYLGEATQEEIETQGYSLGDRIGKMGLEKQLDAVIKGKTGTELIEVDASGQVMRRIGETQAMPGSDVRLTIDAGLQEVLYEALAGRKGAAVASNPETGEILALVSSPSFDPNMFSRRQLLDEQAAKIEAETIGAIFNSQDKPILNRAISGAYPPGSVFKVVPAMAGLEEEVLKRDTEVEDMGELRVESYSYKNWFYTQYGRTEGLVDVVTALKRSNDIFFYKTAEWLGAERLAKWSREFGLGEVTGLELPGEVKGLVPTPLWKERYVGEKWFLGNTYHFGIGQGDLLTTPIQVNQMMGVIASQGKWCQPILVAGIGEEGEIKIACRELGVNPENLEIVKSGLVEACSSGGTAYVFFEFDLAKFGEEYATEGRNRVACKTGTAQFNNPDDNTHAWFSVFAPAVKPEILVTVLIEGGGEGSAEAAPVAKKALEYWFESKE